MNPTEADGGEHDFARALQNLTDEERRSAAASDRRHRHWLGQASRDGGTVLGVLADLGERGIPLTLGMPDRRRASGQIVELTAEAVVLDPTDGRRHVVALRHVGSIRAEPSIGAVAGDREVTTTRTLGDVLVDTAQRGSHVHVATAGGDQWGGSVRHVGLDVMVIEVGTSRRPLYLPLAQVSDVLVR